MSDLSRVLSLLRFDAHGLVPSIAQDERTGKVLMLAYQNAESLTRTLETGLAHYFSRSRNRIWRKGETSGHVQRVRRVLVDCDGDAVLLVVDQTGAACHEGYPTCFFREVTGGAEVVVEVRAFDPETVYGKKGL